MIKQQLFIVNIFYDKNQLHDTIVYLLSVLEYFGIYCLEWDNNVKLFYNISK